jgi:RHS repeat-associated protein
VRLSYNDKNNDGDIDVTPNLNTNELVEESNYYPFGLKHKGYNNVISSNGNSVAQKFGYNGKELEESLGLNLLEMDYRSYDPAIAKWISIDPVTHYSMSTYTAFDNNPIFWADPSGADSWTYVSDGNYRNNQTGEETTNHQRAISETQSHLGESPTDFIKINTKDKTIQITEDGSPDTYEIDGKIVDIFSAIPRTPMGSDNYDLNRYFDDLLNKGYNVRRLKPVGMALTDFVLEIFAGEALFTRSLRFLSRAKRVKQTVTTVNKADPFDLVSTQYITRSKSRFKNLVSEIRMNGITEPIEYAVKDGVKYIQNGHHRAYIAKKLGIKNVPTKEIPYKAGMEFFEQGKNPGYLKHIKW